MEDYNLEEDTKLKEMEQLEIGTSVSNPLLNGSKSGTGSALEKKKEYLSVLYPATEATFVACQRSGSEAHVILNGGGGCRWGKQSPIENRTGLCSNCLTIQIGMFDGIMKGLEQMEKHVKFLKASKGFSQSSSMEANGYRTFAMESSSTYRLNGLVFNDLKVGMARYYNNYLLNGKGANQLILAKHSLLTFDDLDHLYWSLKTVLDATIVGIAQKKEFIKMCFFILSELVALSETEFVKRCSGLGIQKTSMQLFGNSRKKKELQ